MKEKWLVIINHLVVPAPSPKHNSNHKLTIIIEKLDLFLK